jgi:epoxyqueuosine reductase
MSAPAERTARVLAACAELGFDDAGVASADEALFGAGELEAAAETGRLEVLPYLQDSVAERADVQRFLEGARSVLVVVQRYYRGDHEALEPATAEGAKVSRYAWGSDYHNIMRKRLRRLRKRLLRELDVDDDARWAPFCDTEAVLERAWAQAAGLGFVGKSALFIHHRSQGAAQDDAEQPSFGTWTFLGGLVTTVELAPTRAAPAPATHACGSCRRCLDACPTDAFMAPFTLDVARCLTTWSVERPLDEPDDQALAAELRGHGWAVGCDVCQEVCPYNRWATLAPDDRFAPRPGLVALTAATLPDDAQLVGSPLARPGREGLRRSLERALGRGAPSTDV